MNQQTLRINLSLLAFGLLLSACERRRIDPKVIKELGEEFGETLPRRDKSPRLAARADDIQLILNPSELEGKSMFLYAVGPLAGNLGGRAGANKHCESGLRSLPATRSVIAFLAVSEADQIDRMPQKFRLPTQNAIRSLRSRQVIAQNWNALLSDSKEKRQPALKKSLHDAQVFVDGANRWERYEGFFWSGHQAVSASSGTIHNCQGWTKTDAWGRVGGNHGAFHPKYDNAAGLSQAFAYPWYDYQKILPCQEPRYLLCLLY